MTDWLPYIESGYTVPTDRPLADLVAELSGLLRSADPRVRDEIAYSVLATWVGRGVLDDQLTALGDEMAARFDDPEIQARTFAPLILDSVVSRGGYETAWLSSFSRWYRTETDLRDYDPELGWLHAVAHGADLLGAFGASPRLGAAELDGLLGLAADRLLARNDYLFAAWEDDRLAVAIATVLARPDLSQERALGWLVPIADDIAESGWLAPVPAWSSNTMRTLRVLYILIERGFHQGAERELAVFEHRTALLDRLAEVLALVIRRLR